MIILSAILYLILVLFNKIKKRCITLARVSSYPIKVVKDWLVQIDFRNSVTDISCVFGCIN